MTEQEKKVIAERYSLIGCDGFKHFLSYLEKKEADAVTGWVNGSGNSEELRGEALMVKKIKKFFEDIERDFQRLREENRGNKNA